MHDARRHTAASDANHVDKHHAEVYGHDGKSHLAYFGGPGGVLAGLRAQFYSMQITKVRNARQSGAASHSAQFSKHQGELNSSGDST